MSSNQALAAIGFAVALAAALVSSTLLAKQLERFSAKLGLAAGLLGLITALGANTPEITSAIVAIVKGKDDLGSGIIIGSNVFNIAALLGLGALIGGRYRLSRAAVLLNGGVGLSQLARKCLEP